MDPYKYQAYESVCQKDVSYYLAYINNRTTQFSSSSSKVNKSFIS